VCANETYISAKEPCISANELYISVREPCVSAKEVCIHTKSPTSLLESLISAHKRALHINKKKERE